MAEEKGTEAIRDRNRRIREEAAQKRRSKREGERRPAPAQRLDATEIMDDAVSRTVHVAGIWLKRHFNVVQWVVVAGVVGGIGWQVYSHHRDKVEGKATDLLIGGVTEELSRVGDQPAEEDPQTGLVDPRPTHATDEQRLKVAVEAYRKATGDDTLGQLARLGLAGVLFDQGKYKDALAEYRAVRESKLGQSDADARARAIEGMGLSQEALGELDAAQKSFHELENQDSAAFGALGLYHQARLDKQKGALDKAKAHLTAALKKLSDTKVARGYVEQASRDLLMSIDPTAVPPVTPASLSPEQLAEFQKRAKVGGGKKDVSPEQMKELLKQLSQKTPRPAPPAAPVSSAP